MKAKPSALNIHEISYLLDMSDEAALAILRHSGIPIVIERSAIRIPAKEFFDWYDLLMEGGAA